ncbi:MAG: SDR family oxidoreductase [Rhodospirillales bacterium]|nr:SDR family oxidoreductase [Rhodospirillales bacterium]QQS13318.1 MAG: SDR family oxidoreductase [Rhodospirillales bacterium]
MPYRSVLRPGIFAGQTMMVTGGGSGLGRCAAHEMAALGAHVVITGRKTEKLEAVKAEIEADGGACSFQAFDIREEQPVKDAIAAIVAERGRVHGLFNNAGGQFPAPAEAISQRGFDAVVRNNLTGGFLVAREVYLQSMRDHGGSIVFMSADMRNGMPGMVHSGAARSGTENLAMTLAFEWGHAGVRVNTVSPGWIASSGMDTYEGEFKRAIPLLKNHVPVRRLGTESEVSAAVCFLMSEAAGFVTGLNFRIDGGVPLGTRNIPLPDGRGTEAYHGFHRTIIPKVLGG